MTDADRLAAIEARASIARTRTYGEWPVAYDEDATYLLRRLREVEAERDHERQAFADVAADNLREQATRDAAEADAARLADRVAALEQLAACLRIEKRPPESLFRRLDATAEAARLHDERVTP
jgi:hypothetical protein